MRSAGIFDIQDTNGVSRQALPAKLQFTQQRRVPLPKKIIPG